MSRYGSTPSGVTIRTSSPISRPASSTVSASITTSFSACGGSPVSSKGDADPTSPIVGAPPPEITSSVCGSITCAAAHTAVRRCHTRQRLDIPEDLLRDGVPLLAPPPPPPAAMSWKAFSACTTTSVFEKMSPKRSSNAESAVSVHERPRDEPDPEHDG